MYSRCLSLLILATVSLHGRVLRVCADPNNLPFSNQAGQGFENRLAELVAHDVGASLRYAWWPGREHSLDRSLKAGDCDLLFGVPAGMEGVLLTHPYYESSYVFVSRLDRAVGVSSLADLRLAQFRIGVQVVAEDYAPPAVMLARRGLSANIVGFSLFGEAGQTDPQSRIVDAVRRGDVDIAIVWGPLAGYFAKRPGPPLEIKPVSPESFLGIPFTFAMSAAVRQDDETLQKEVDHALAHECRAIQALLTEFGVPSLGEDQTRCDAPPLSPVVWR